LLHKLNATPQHSSLVVYLDNLIQYAALRRLALGPEKALPSIQSNVTANGLDGVDDWLSSAVPLLRFICRCVAEIGKGTGARSNSSCDGEARWPISHCPLPLPQV
jgi:hypothetical protein